MIPWRMRLSEIVGRGAKRRAIRQRRRLMLLLKAVVVLIEIIRRFRGAQRSVDIGLSRG